MGGLNERIFMFEEMREQFNKSKIDLNDKMYKVKMERQQQDIKIHNVHQEVENNTRKLESAMFQFESMA